MQAVLLGLLDETGQLGVNLLLGAIGLVGAHVELRGARGLIVHLGGKIIKTRIVEQTITQERTIATIDAMDAIKLFGAKTNQQSRLAVNLGSLGADAGEERNGILVLRLKVFHTLRGPPSH